MSKGNRQAQQCLDSMREIAVSSLMESINHVQKEHIPELITAGSEFCAGVLRKSQENTEFDKFMMLVIYSEFVMTKIYQANEGLGAEKFSTDELFRNYLDALWNAIVKALRETSNAQSIIRPRDRFWRSKHNGFAYRILEISKGKPQAQQYLDSIRDRTVPLLMRRINPKLDSHFQIQRNHIPKLITAGSQLCVAVCKNMGRSQESSLFDKFIKPVIYRNIVMTKIYQENEKLGAEKFTTYKLFGDFLVALLNEVVKASLEKSIAQSIIRPWNRFCRANWVREVFIYVLIIYRLYYLVKGSRVDDQVKTLLN